MQESTPKSTAKAAAKSQARGREGFKVKVNFKSQIKGVGQECPTHTADKTLQYGL
jgi:hypothetical protein